MTAAQPAAAVPKNFKAEADLLLSESWKADGPGAAVIVTEGGRTVYAAGRGLADLEAKTPITPDTVFRLGSIAKQFSAAVMLQLVAEGKVSLDDPLSKYFPDYPQPGAAATVRQLLNHTSGIASYTSIPGWMVEANTNKPYTTAQMIDLFKAVPAPSKPGEEWTYNNSGYVLVGAIIEKVTGKPWHQAIAGRIAAPLKLSTIRFGEEQLPNMAKGYTIGENGGFEPAPKIHMSVPHAAGGLIGTVGDLAVWADALHKGRVLTPATYEGMITPAKLNGGAVHPYGFGLQLADLRGMKTRSHGGGIFGFVTASMYIPEKDVFVAVFSNVVPPVTSPDLVAAKLAALAAGDPFPSFTQQRANLKTLEPYFGVYKMAADDTRIFFARDGKLFTRRSDGPPLEVFAAGNNRFFYDDGLTWFALRRGVDGPVMEMHRPANRAPEVAARAGPVPAEARPADVPRETLARYVGSYLVGGPKAVVTLGEEGLSVKLGDQPNFKLIARSQTEFEVEGVGARVTFNADAGAPAKSITINQSGRKIEAMRTAD
jgi:CubicO group peptidase (beta-lactamase class C family)